MSTQIGRVQLFTDEPEITYENVIDVLRTAYNEYQPTINRIDYLLDFEAGKQPLVRKTPKTYRADIDCEVTDNIANEIVEFKLGFNWGSPITLVQRGAKDSGTSGETDAISLLNECYEAEGIKKKTQELARFIEIDGIGYTYVEINKTYQEGDSYFKIEVLDPRYAFVVRSAYYMDNRVILGVTFRRDRKGNRHFTCFTKDRRFEILNLTEIVNGEVIPEENRWQHKVRSGEENPLGRIPITEYIRSHDRMGCFERQISEMNNLNLMLSDVTNDIEQTCQSMWHTNDVDFPTKKEKTTDENGNEIEVETVVKPKSGEWLQTYSTQEGRTPIVEALNINYNYEGMLSNIESARLRILEKCDVPNRGISSGGSTGKAEGYATGFTAAETAAEKEQGIIESCKMEEVKSVLAAIFNSTDVPADSPLLTLRYIDMEPSFKRNKNYELTTKANFFATMISHGVYGLHALKKMDAFEDVNQVWNDSKPLIEAYQRSIFEKNTNEAVGGEGEEAPNADRADQDESDQISNSPLIDGMKTA